MAWTISNAMMRDYENWLCSQGRAAESSAVTCSGGAPSAQSSTTPTPDQYYWPDKTTEHSRLSRFGMMCVLLTESLGQDVLTWFLAAFRARTLAAQVPAQGLAANEADYGPKWHGSLTRYDRATSSWKTAQCSLLGDSEEFSETWPKWGLMLGGVCLALDISLPVICEKESGLWHPTPTKSDYKGGNFRGEKQRESQLKEWLHVRYSQGMKTTYPHPLFLERVMAWPQEWTELAPLGMGKFQVWQQQHGESFQIDSKRQKQE